MRRIYLLFVFLVATASVAAASGIDFTWSHPRPQGNAIFGLHFAGDQEGWAVARGGGVLHTLDGGDTWAVLREWSPNYADLYDVEQLTSGTLLACAEFGRILRSLDNGQTWQLIQTPATGDLRDLALRPDGSISASGEHGAVVVSIDDGQTWVDVGPGFGIGEHHLWLGGAEAYVVGIELAHRTLDGGATWNEVFPPPFGGLSEVFEAGVDSLVITHDFGHWHSEDGGSTWNEITRFVPPFYSARTVVLESGHWIQTMNGEGGELWETFDAGANWQQIYNRDCVGFPSIELLPGGRVVAASDIGDLITSDDHGNTFTNRATNLTGDGVSSDIATFIARPDGVVFVATQRPLSGDYTWLRSDDGGANWSIPTAAPVALRIHGGAFHDELLGLVLTDAGVSRTIDGGVSWVNQALPIGVNATHTIDMRFRNRILMTADQIGAAGMLRSRDEGLSWEAIGGGLPTGFAGRALARHASGVGLCGGEQAGVPSLYRTTDGGDSWTAIGWSGRTPTDFEFVDDQSVFAADGDRVWRSSNAGLSWQIADDERATHVVFADAYRGVSYSQVAIGVRVSHDGGLSWSAQDVPFRGAIPELPTYGAVTAAVAKPGPGARGWLLGGQLNRILVAELVNASDVGTRSPSNRGLGVEILDAYPNPFNPRVSVRFTVERSGEIRAVVYDLRGRRVRDLGPRRVEAGVRVVNWNGADSRGQAVASGSYLVRLSTQQGWDVVEVALVR